MNFRLSSFLGCVLLLCVFSCQSKTDTEWVGEEGNKVNAALFGVESTATVAFPSDGVLWLTDGNNGGQGCRIRFETKWTDAESKADMPTNLHLTIHASDVKWISNNKTISIYSTESSGTVVCHASYPDLDRIPSMTYNAVIYLDISLRGSEDHNYSGDGIINIKLENGEKIMFRVKSLYLSD